jgi:hypothetical protein
MNTKIYTDSSHRSVIPYVQCGWVPALLILVSSIEELLTGDYKLRSACEKLFLRVLLWVGVLFWRFLVRHGPPFIGEWKEAPSRHWVGLGPLAGSGKRWYAMLGHLYFVHGGFTCIYSLRFNHLWCLFRVTHLWQNHLKNEGFVSQDHIGGFSTKRECANTHK